MSMDIFSGGPTLGRGLGFDFTKDCPTGQYWSTFGQECVSNASSNWACPEGQEWDGYGCKDLPTPSASGPCKAGQVQWSENGVDKCGTMAEYNAFVAKVTGSGTKTTGGGGFVKPTVPVTPGVVVEDGVDWKPLAAMAVLAAAVVTIIVRKRNRGMTSNSHGYDEDC